MTFTGRVSAMFQRPWRGPSPQSSWRLATLGPGLYVIGKPQDPTAPMGRCLDSEGKLGGFPGNFLPLYIGSSQSERYGVRTRLRRHFSGRGNRLVAEAVLKNEPLYFIDLPGADMAGYEAIYLHIQAGFAFPFNRRPEATRYMRRVVRELEEAGCIPTDPFLMHQPVAPFTKAPQPWITR